MIKMKSMMFSVVMMLIVVPMTFAHAQSTTKIDPSEDERPLPGPLVPGKPKLTITDSLGQWDMTVHTEQEIDPETEYPILGKKNPYGLNIDPENEYPILGKKGVLTLIEMGALSVMEVQSWARVLTTDPELKMYAAEITLSAVAASMFITLYRVASLGGRQRVLAAIIPPGLILDQLGRSGYKVPAHSVYSPEDAMAVAEQLASLSPQEAEVYIKTLDAELLEYFSTVVYYVRAAKAKELMEWCPNLDLCT